MSHADPSPWMPLVSCAVGLIVVYGLAVLVQLVIRLVVHARDSLRDRYIGGDCRLHWLDLLGIPTWLVFEVTCFVGGIVAGLFILWAMYSVAKDARNWWHARDD